MFLPWNIFILGIFQAAFHLLLVSALSSLVSIYSRFGSEYGHSIRWIRAGGYLDMIQCLDNSRWNSPTYIRVYLVITIIASFVANFADKGAGHFILPAVRPFNSSYYLADILQFSNPDNIYTATSGWSSPVIFGANVTDTIIRMMNSTSRNVPERNPGRTYTPTTSTYDRLCNDLNIMINDVVFDVLFPPSGCLNVSITSTLLTSSPPVTFVNASPGRWSFQGQPPLVPPGSPLPIFDLKVEIKPPRLGRTSLPLGGTAKEYFETGYGTMALPRTYFAKAIYTESTMATLSYTTTKFSNATESFDLAVKNILLEHDDDLIQSMGANIRNYSSIPNRQNEKVYFEVRASSSLIDAFICHVHSECFLCTYNHIVAFSLLTDGVDPSLLPMANINTQSPVLMLEHYPNMINNTMVPFSIANLTEATKDAAEYMALLGRNFGATTSLPSWLNVLYSTTDEEHGLEIPAWLFYGMITTMAVCLVLRVGTILFLNGRYKNSLYKVIANKVVLRTKSDAPMLMRVKVEPLEIEGLRIFPDDGGDQDNLEMEEYGSTTRLMSRNDEDDKDK